MTNYYQLEISLKGIRPRIWRRLLIRLSASFGDLHEAIQALFAWDSSHLWEFRHRGARHEPIAGVVFEELWGHHIPDAYDVKLSDFFRVGDKRADRCEYVYDFGDDWVHLIKLNKVRAEDESFERRLLSGKRAAPLDDCGGLPGYARMVEFVETGEDPYGDPDSIVDWVEGWRPEAFDLEAIKAWFDH